MLDNVKTLLNSIKHLIDQKLDKPLKKGLKGEVLTSNGEGKSTWEKPQDFTVENAVSSLAATGFVEPLCYENYILVNGDKILCSGMEE